jgi:hypothetical protein
LQIDMLCVSRVRNSLGLRYQADDSYYPVGVNKI